MVDIAKCANEDCTLKEKCYRYTSKPDEYWQSYMDFKQIDGKCDDFWDISKYK